jgi:hypothetical protein
MRCIWCDHETTSDESTATDQVRYANKEHIFPEAVGGKRCLPQGLVCKQCNDDLGKDVDQYLKVSDISMMHQYQIVDGIPGKSRGKEDRLRKLAQKEEINHYTSGTMIKRSQEESSIDFVNAEFYLYDEKLSRALHKCLINSIVDMQKLEKLPEALQAIKNYVISGEGQETGWALGLAYANVFRRYDFEPFCDTLFLDAAGNVVAGVLVFPSLLAIAGCAPNTITKEFLWINARKLYKTKHQTQPSTEGALDLISYFKGHGFSEISDRKSVHQKMHMILVRNHKRGHPIPGKLQCLARCVYCGQVNSTGVVYEKAQILQQSNHNYGGSKNDWNAYEPEDMSLIFDAAEMQYFDRIFKNYQGTGIQVDIKKLESLRKTWAARTICCIGCGGYTYAQPKDFFF